jgi:AbrB family looped-hinge helix DNA binding protein
MPIPKTPAEQFYGVTTIGEKGQLVVPVEARAAMGLDKGDKLLVFGLGDDILMLAKLSNLEKFATRIAGRLEALNDVIRKTKSD